MGLGIVSPVGYRVVKPNFIVEGCVHLVVDLVVDLCG